MAMSKTLAELVLKLTADSTEFRDHLKKADAQSKRWADTQEKSARRVSNAMKLAGVALAALASREIIEAFNRQDQAVRQLEARLKSTGGVVGFTSQQIQDMASSLQQVTTFGDEATLEMQALLLTFTQIRGPIFKQATEAVQNMAVAMDKDLKSSALQLGKALNDPIRGVSALAESGIQFSEDQRNMIRSLVETGQQAKAQAVILKELETQFGGAAAAARQGLGGAITGLSNAFGDNLEKLGSVGNKSSVIGALNSLEQTVSSPGFMAGLDAIATTFGIIAEGAALTVKAIGDIINSDLAQVVPPDMIDMMMQPSHGLNPTVGSAQTRLGRTTEDSGQSFSSVGNVTESVDLARASMEMFVQQYEGMTGDVKNIDQEAFMARLERQQAVTAGLLEMAAQEEELRRLQLEGEYEQLEQMREFDRLRVESAKQAASERLAAEQALASGVSGLISGVTSVAGKEGQKLNAIYQTVMAARALAQAFSFAVGAAADTPGPLPVRLAAYGAALGQGLGALAAINQAFSGGGSGGGGGTTAAGSAGAGGVAVPSAVETPEPTQRTGEGTIMLRFDTIIGTEEWVQNNLAPAIREVANRDVDFGFEVRRA